MIPTWIERKASQALIVEVMRHMKLHHTGRDHAATLDTLIGEMFGPSAFDDEYKVNKNISRLTRLCFETANREHSGMIVSDTEAGYWWSDGDKADYDAIDRLESRAKTILSNAAHLRSNIQAGCGGQARML